MKKLLVIISILTFQASFAQGDVYDKNYEQQLRNQTRLMFEENLGQVANDQGEVKNNVFFRLSDNNMNLFVTEWGLTYYFVHYNEQPKVNESPSYGWERLDMILEGATINKSKIKKEGKSEAFSNYYYPHCPNGVLNVFRYGKVTMEDVYPNIDWVIYRSGNNIKYDFIVHPGGNPKDIKIKYQGVDELSMQAQETSLSIQGKNIRISDEDLLVKSGENELKASFNKVSDNTYTFKLDQGYDKELPLVIDPVLRWNTYIGNPTSNNGDNGFDVALDATHVYMTGSVNSLSFPLQNPGGGAYYQSTYGGGTGAAGDVPICKFTHAGALVWSTYYGGSSNESGYGIEVDGSNVYIAGYTNSTNLPTQNPGGGAFFQGTFGGSFDGCILKFSLAGVRQWATYYGGSNYDGFEDVTILGGNVFFVGATSSTNFPVFNPGGGAYYQGSNGGTQDGMIVKFNSSSVRQWSTYYGGSANDGFHSIDHNGSIIFVAAATSSTNFPTLNPGGGAYFQAANGGSSDQAVISFNGSTSSRIWATYLGGSGSETYPTLAVDATNIYVSGVTGSTNFPTMNPGGGAYFQGANAGNNDYSISKFSTSGAMQWSTYYGGAGNEFFGLSGGKVAVNSTNLYVAVRTFATGVPLQTLAGSYNQTYSGGQESVLIEFNKTTNARNWASYFGGSADDIIWGIAADDSYIYATGVTLSSSAAGFPVTDPGGGAFYDGAFSSLYHTFLAQFPACEPGVNTTSTADICENATKTLTASTSDGTWSIVSGGGSIAGTTYTPPNVASNTSVTVRYTDACGATSDVTFTVNVLQTANNTTTTTDICENSTKTLTGTPGGGTWSIVSGGGSIAGTTYTPANVSSNTLVTVRYTIPINGACPADTDDAIFTVNVLEPAVNTTTTTSICEGGDKSLTGTPSGGTWNIVTGGGSITGATYTAPAVAGATSVTVRYTIAANGACPASTDDVTFTVDDNVPPSNTTNTDTICESATKALTGTPGGGTFNLLTGGGSITGTTYTPGSINSPDFIEIDYVSPASGSCPAGNDTISFVVMPLPEPIITSVNDTMCDGTTRLLTGTPVGGTFSVVSGSATISNDTLLATGSGTLVVQYVAFNAFGCSDSVTQNIEIITSPTNPTVTASSDTICRGEQVTITGSGSGGGVTYNVYSTLTGSSWLGVTPYTVTPALTSTYYIDADNGTCMNTGGRQPITVVVNPVPTVNVTPDTTICPTTFVTLVATGGASYVWSNGDTTSSTTVSPLVDTVYTVTVTNSFNCSNQGSVNVFVLTGSIIDAGDDSATVRSNTDTTINIAVNDIGDPANIVVLSGANHGTDTIINGVLTYRSDSNYVGNDTIVYQICDGICISLCDTAVIYLRVERDLLIPEFFTPNGDNFNDEFVILGLEKYPDNSIKIFNRWGSMVFQEAPFNGAWDGISDGSLIGSTNLPSGTYYYILDLGDGSEPVVGYVILKD